ncbi:unnamed protein product [Protopolystoma xenopodis]|uniref:Uncharacterized protein n=1 Tax=Protopolystoma xenopodis TaxID=117903 RepID=A0A448XR85_9PLAT|nr:unnamed protein product [Protopolystoma xenopodis]
MRPKGNRRQLKAMDVLPMKLPTACALTNEPAFTTTSRHCSTVDDSFPQSAVLGRGRNSQKELFTCLPRGAMNLQKQRQATVQTQMVLASVGFQRQHTPDPFHLPTQPRPFKTQRPSIHMLINPSIHLSVHPSIYLLIHLSIYSSNYSSTRQFISS